MSHLLEKQLVKKSIILFLALCTFLSCSIPKDENLLGVSIRLTNISQYDFKNIIVNTSTGDTAFEDIDAGESTNYQVFELAYRYAFVELEIDGQTFTLEAL